MVTDAIFDWFFGLFDWMIQGASDMTDGLPESLTDFTFMGDMNYFLPFSEMFALFFAFFLLGTPMAGISLIVWLVVGVFRGGATKA